MATNEEQQSPEQEGTERGEDLTEAAQTGEAKGGGVSPGHAGEAHIGDRPAEAGQVPPA
jgi:hypothetical protein